MKCQKCGKYEANFHYTTSINGRVTEYHLCAECAAKSGFDVKQEFDFNSILDGVFPSLGGLGGFGDTGGLNGLAIMGFPMSGVYQALPYAVAPQPATAPNSSGCSCGSESCMPDIPGAKVDDEMKKRREINMLREQMRIAAAKDDYEKAIELREKIKEMEQA